MEPIQKYYRAAAATLLTHMKKRRMDAVYVDTAEEAVQEVLKRIPDGSVVSWGGSMTLKEIGLFEELEKTPCTLLDRSKAADRAEATEIYRKALTSDVYLMSTNALTRDGKLVNIDGNGNRLAALIYGPKKVIVVTGMNKVVDDEEAAVKRIKYYASPVNCQRLEKETPCAKSGFCGECLGDDSICSNTVITRRSHEPGRVTVILVGQSLGY